MLQKLIPIAKQALGAVAEIIYLQIGNNEFLVMGLFLCCLNSWLAFEQTQKTLQNNVQSKRLKKKELFTISKYYSIK